MIKDRLEKIMQKHNLTAAKLAEMLDVQPSAISHLLSGRNKPSFDFLLRIATKMPQINMDWLITGKGNMTKAVVQQSLFSDKDTIDDINHEHPKSHSHTIEPQPPTRIVEKDKNYNKITDVNYKKVITRIVFIYNDNTFDSFAPNAID